MDIVIGGRIGIERIGRIGIERRARAWEEMNRERTTLTKVQGKRYSMEIQKQEINKSFRKERQWDQNDSIIFITSN